MNDAVRYLPGDPDAVVRRTGPASRWTGSQCCARRAAHLGAACAGRTVTVPKVCFRTMRRSSTIQPDDFSPQRVQDELVGQMAGLLEADYDTLALEINDSESRSEH